MLRITHTFLDGTLIDGTGRGDGSAEILKSHGWRWGRSIGMWFVPRSRERVANAAGIEAVRQALVAAGFEVEVEVDQSRPAVAEVEQAKVIRQEGRVEALQARAERAGRASGAAWGNAHARLDRLPPGGEPIKVGHHSERRHRADIAKADRALSQAVEADRERELAEQRAAAAASTTGARYSPVTVWNRIRRIEAEVRAVRRDVEGASSSDSPEMAGWRAERGAALAQLQEELEFWQGIRAEQITAGVATNYGPQDVKVGDAVRVGRWWREVVRVNSTTVTVATEVGRGRVPYVEISDHRSR
jgi:hypothetical protein